MEVRGTTSLLDDVTVGSTTTPADLIVTGKANLLNKVTVGTSTTPADLEITGESTVEGGSSLLGDVTIGNTAGTTANLLITGTTEVRGTSNLLADVTVGSTTTAADLTVTGEAHLLSRVTVGTIASPADIEVSRGALIRGTSSLLGAVTIGNATGRTANLLVTGTTEIRGSTTLLGDVSVGSTTSASDLTVTGTTNLQGNSNIGNLGADGVLGGNDDSTTIIRGTLNLTDANILGLSSGSGSPSSSEISNSSASFNVSSLGIEIGDKMNLFVKLRISGGNTTEYLKMKQVTLNSSSRTYQFEFPFNYSVYTEDLASIPRTVKTIGVVERRIIVEVYISSRGNISIRNPYFKQNSYYVYPRHQNFDFALKKGYLDDSDGADRVTSSKEYKA